MVHKILYPRLVAQAVCPHRRWRILRVPGAAAQNRLRMNRVKLVNYIGLPRGYLGNNYIVIVYRVI